MERSRVRRGVCTSPPRTVPRVPAFVPFPRLVFLAAHTSRSFLKTDEAEEGAGAARNRQTRTQQVELPFQITRSATAVQYRRGTAGLRSEAGSACPSVRLRSSQPPITSAIEFVLETGKKNLSAARAARPRDAAPNRWLIARSEVQSKASTCILSPHGGAVGLARCLGCSSYLESRQRRRLARSSVQGVASGETQAGPAF